MKDHEGITRKPEKQNAKPCIPAMFVAGHHLVTNLDTVNYPDLIKILNIRHERQKEFH